jgi:hypothetical protein
MAFESFIAELGARAPKKGIVQPKPEHMKILSMKAEGFTNEEIAKACNYSRDTVSLVCRQMWFQEALTKHIEQTTGKLQKLFENESIESFNVLLEIRDDPTNSSAVRLKACQYIHDRVLGQTTQKVESSSTVKHVNVSDIDGELAAVERELAAAESEGDFRSGTKRLADPSDLPG